MEIQALVFPKINGKKSVFKDYTKFHFEISLNNGDTYMPLSAKYQFRQGSYTGGKQYGYWTNKTNSGEIVSGIWIREVKESMKVKVSLVSDKSKILYMILKLKLELKLQLHQCSL